jgi:hypothetical protein
MPRTQLSRRACLAQGVGLGLLLTGCGAPPVVPTPAGELPPPPSGWRERLDGPGSGLRVHVFRAGAAAHLGHNHVIEAGDLRAELIWPDAAAARANAWPKATLVLSFSLDALVIDPPALRARLGPDFASTLSDEDRAGTLANLRRALAAERFPQVRVQTTRIVGEGPVLAVEAAVAWHGQVRALPLSVSVDGPRAKGSAVLRQSDFGIQPFSVLGGLLAVRDEVVVEFELVRHSPTALNRAAGS